MEGAQVEHSVFRYLNYFNVELLIILWAVLAIVLISFALIWLHNRKKFHKFKHQIPADVVKNYLDSIIQNSESLKSSLFRGGGTELGAGIPAVMNLSSLAGDGASQEELNRKNAEISQLMAQLTEKGSTIQDLEKRIKELEGKLADGSGVDVSSYENKIAELESALADAEKKLAAKPSAGGGASGEELDKLRAELEEVTRERDEYHDRLQEYAIIEDDLANLKRLQQENAQLRKALQDAGIAIPALDALAAEEPEVTSSLVEEVPEEEPVVEEEPASEEEAPVEEEPAVEEEAPSLEDMMEAAEAVQESEVVEEEVAELAAPEPAEEEGHDAKTAEDLLSEFEKMLG